MDRFATSDFLFTNKFQRMPPLHGPRLGKKLRLGKFLAQPEGRAMAKFLSKAVDPVVRDIVTLLTAWLSRVRHSPSRITTYCNWT